MQKNINTFSAHILSSLFNSILSRNYKLWNKDQENNIHLFFSLFPLECSVDAKSGIHFNMTNN